MNDCLLVISAKPDLRELIRATFEDEYEVHEADSGKFGLRMARAILPEVIFIDESLPGEPDGSSLHELLKANPRLAGIRLVLLNTERHNWLRMPAHSSPAYGLVDIAGGLLHDALAA